MQPKALKLLHDAIQAGRLAFQFAEARSLEDYLSDAFLRSAIERQLFIVGEAISQLSQVDSEAFDALPKSRKIVAFRNLLAHGYGEVDNSRVWAMLGEELPGTMEQLQERLGEGA